MTPSVGFVAMALRCPPFLNASPKAPILGIPRSPSGRRLRFLGWWPRTSCRLVVDGQPAATGPRQRPKSGLQRSSRLYQAIRLTLGLLSGAPTRGRPSHEHRGLATPTYPTHHTLDRRLRRPRAASRQAVTASDASLSSAGGWDVHIPPATPPPSRRRPGRVFDPRAPPGCPRRGGGAPRRGLRTA